MPLRTVPLLALLLLGCAGARRPEPVEVRDSPWYPLRVGMHWVYRGAGLPLARRVVRHERVGEFDCALIESRRGNKPFLLEHVCTRPDGVYLVAVDGNRITPPLRFLKLPPHGGESWTIGFREGNAARTGVYLLEKGEVTVPAKKYHALILRGEIQENGMPKRAFTYWFAEGVGMVKQAVRGDKRTLVYELESFDKR
jgi:hypothetical protein